MKKILVTMTVAAFVFGALTMAGCGKKEESSSTTTTTTTETSTTTDTSMAPMDTTMMDTTSSH